MFSEAFEADCAVVCELVVDDPVSSISGRYVDLLFESPLHAEIRSAEVRIVIRENGVRIFMMYRVYDDRCEVWSRIR